ncbi:NF041680 family putative transposase [Pseudonocardia lacus]|uniref:NF041680 family putative transposase n=1 Tax=Pseudonocardia lacus TaxID=2835865 RepID=UPI0027E3ADE7|nr:NF041680 family putative transposase [Pseudonocardia lacus]
MGSLHDHGRASALGELSRFRREFHTSLTARADVLFELTEAVLCVDGPVTSLVELTLVAEHRRGHGAMYDAINHGRVEPERLRRTLASLPLPKTADGRIVLTVDVSPWLRPDAPTSPERLFCHVYGRGKGNAQLIPGWPYSFIAAQEAGASSWTALLDAVRLGPADDATAVTATQLRDVIARLTDAGQWQSGDPPILIVTDAGYDITRLAYVLSDLPVELAGRIRSDRVLRLPTPARLPGTNGRPPRHGPEIALDRPTTWPTPQHTTRTETTRYGAAVATSWDRVHPRLTRRGCWLDHDAELPIIEGTLIRLQVEHLPGDRDPKPVWLWTSTTAATAADVDRFWQAFLRRFDIEHTFRLLKQTLGWTTPKIRTPAAADRWTWLLIAAHTQLRLARPLAADLRRPWERPAAPGRLTPARVRRSFRNIRPRTAQPASAPKPTRPGPGHARSARATTDPHPATMSARRSNATAPSPLTSSAQVKDQAQA